MGLFDNLFKSPATSNFSYSFKPKNEQEAWVAIMYGCIAADGEVSESESSKLLEILCFKSAFRTDQVVSMYKNAMTAHQQLGSKEIINSSVASIPEENKATLLAVLMELLLADGILGEKEKEIAEYVTTSLDINPVLAQQIIEVMLIKNKGNVILTD